MDSVVGGVWRGEVLDYIILIPPFRKRNLKFDTGPQINIIEKNHQGMTGEEVVMKRK